MTKKLKSLCIFISSPGDVVEERTLTKRVLQRLQGEFSGRAILKPIFWEHEPLLATDSFQRQIVRPSETDIMVTILWSRLGTRLPSQFTREDGSRYSSGTEFEFEDAVTSYRQDGKPDLLVYRKTADPVVSLKDKKILLDKLNQKEALDVFFEKWFHDKSEGTLIAAFHPFENSADFEELLEVHLKKLIERRVPKEAPGKEIKAAPAQWQKGSPFRGLHVFNFEHAPVFFGRTKAVGDVLNALRVQSSEGRAFVLVLGMSGGGKSSLIQAGVLPVLTQPGVIEGVGLWRRAIMRPGDSSGDMFDALAASLLQNDALSELAQDSIDPNELAQLLRESPKAVLPLLKSVLSRAASEIAKKKQMKEKPSAKLVLVVDQMEEMFTLERVTQDERESFMETLNTLARSGWIWIIATLRSDFYPRGTELEKLIALKEGAGQYDLLPPTPAEIGQMIRQPAQAAGLHFEEDPSTKERLDETLRDAASKNPGSLALLEFTLEELFKNRTKKGYLTQESYKKLGGVEGALAQRAEEVYDGLASNVQSVFGQVFHELVSIGQKEEDTITRKYAPLNLITLMPENKKFVEAFIEARLFVSDLDDKGNAVVSVAHEALLQHWPRLQDWVEKNKEDLRAHARVSAAASRWVEEGKSKDFLLSAGKPLAEAAELIKSPSLDLPEGERSFIVASIAKKRRIKWLKRGVVAVLALLTVIAVSMAIIANKQQQRARIEAKTSNQVSEFLVNLFAVSDPSEARGNSITAREVLDKGVTEVEEELKDQPEIQATLMTTMGQVYQGLGLYKQATPLLENALNIRKRLYGDEHQKVCVSISNMAYLLVDKGDFANAESLLRTAAETYRKLNGNRRDFADILANLAGVLLDKGDYDEADALYLEELAIRRELSDGVDIDIARTIHNRGGICLQRGDFKEAESQFREALKMRQELLGDDHPEVAITLDVLSQCIGRQGKYEQAEPICRNALAIRRKLLGNEHPDVGLNINNLGWILIKQEKYQEAEPLMRESLAIQRKALGNKHHWTAFPLNNLAKIMLERNMYEEAEAAYRECLFIFREAFGKEHPNIATVTHNLGSLLYKMEKYVEAEPIMIEALDMRRKFLIEDHPEIAKTLYILASVYVKKGKHNDAHPLFQESLDIRQKALLEGHLLTIQSKRELGNCLAKLKRFEEAEKLLLECFANLETKSEIDTEEITKTLDYIVDLYTTWGKPDKATEYQAKLQGL